MWDLSKIGEEQSAEDAEDGPPELLVSIIILSSYKIRGIYLNQRAIGLLVKCCVSNFSQFSSHGNETCYP